MHKHQQEEPPNKSYGRLIVFGVLVSPHLKAFERQKYTILQIYLRLKFVPREHARLKICRSRSIKNF